jgi:hypothetical protein
MRLLAIRAARAILLKSICLLRLLAQSPRNRAEWHRNYSAPHLASRLRSWLLVGLIRSLQARHPNWVAWLAMLAAPAFMGRQSHDRGAPELVLVRAPHHSISYWRTDMRFRTLARGWPAVDWMLLAVLSIFATMMGLVVAAWWIIQ